MLRAALADIAGTRHGPLPDAGTEPDFERFVQTYAQVDAFMHDVLASFDQVGAALNEHTGQGRT